MLKQLSFLAILILILAIVSFLPINFSIKSNLFSSSNPFDVCMSISNSDKAEECYSKTMLSKIKNNPADTQNIFKSLYKKRVSPSFNGSTTFHKISHEAGVLMATLIRDPYEAFSYCGDQFQSGCYHGVVMTYIDESQTNSAFSFKKAFAFCDGLKARSYSAQLYSHCVHAIGHIGILKVEGNIKKALQGCDLSQLNLRGTCYDGVFMEYSRGDSQNGVHFHERPWGTVAVPCEELQPIYKPACYYALGRVNPVNAKNGQDNYGVGRLCDSVEKDYRYFCSLGLGKRILMENSFDINMAASVCAGLGKYKDDCKEAVIAVIVYYIDVPKDPNDLCVQLAGDLMNSCVQGKIAYYNLMLP